MELSREKILRPLVRGLSQLLCFGNSKFLWCAIKCRGNSSWKGGVFYVVFRSQVSGYADKNLDLTLWAFYEARQFIGNPLDFARFHEYYWSSTFGWSQPGWRRSEKDPERPSFLSLRASQKFNGFWCNGVDLDLLVISYRFSLLPKRRGP